MSLSEHCGCFFLLHVELVFQFVCFGYSFMEWEKSPLSQTPGRFKTYFKILFPQCLLCFSSLTSVAFNVPLQGFFFSCFFLPSPSSFLFSVFLTKKFSSISAKGLRKKSVLNAVDGKAPQGRVRFVKPVYIYIIWQFRFFYNEEQNWL